MSTHSKILEHLIKLSIQRQEIADKVTRLGEVEGEINKLCPDLVSEQTQLLSDLAYMRSEEREFASDCRIFFEENKELCLEFDQIKFRTHTVALFDERVAIGVALAHCPQYVKLDAKFSDWLITNINENPLLQVPFQIAKVPKATIAKDLSSFLPHEVEEEEKTDG